MHGKMYLEETFYHIYQMSILFILIFFLLAVYYDMLIVLWSLSASWHNEK